MKKEEISEEKEGSADSVEVSGQKAHTPGPWEIHTLLSGSENAKGFRLWSSINEWGCKTWIADVSPVIKDGGDASDEGRANAALIAAAPELLEALQDALYWLRQTPVMWSEPIDKAEAAIRKATSVGRGTAANTPPGNPKDQEAIQSQVAIADRVYEASEKNPNLQNPNL